eukprot:3785095-Prymnesium_polylepis.1
MRPSLTLAEQREGEYLGTGGGAPAIRYPTILSMDNIDDGEGPCPSRRRHGNASPRLGAGLGPGALPDGRSGSDQMSTVIRARLGAPTPTEASSPAAGPVEASR